MSSVGEVASPSPSLVPSGNVGVSQCPDFSFAMGHATFVDCTLRLYSDVKGCDPSSSASSPAMSKEIKVSSLVLSFNCGFFKSMFIGSFKESAEKIVDLHLTAEQALVFDDFIAFLYKGSLSEAASRSFQTIVAILTLADQYQAGACLCACAVALRGFMVDLNGSQAMAILSLPDTLLEHPELKDMKEKAKNSVVKENVRLFSGREDPKKNGALKKLSPLAFTTILEADDVPQREDKLLDIACLWADLVSSSEQERLELLFVTVLPRIRISYLSPSRVQFLMNTVKNSLVFASLTDGEVSEETVEDMESEEDSLEKEGKGPLEAQDENEYAQESEADGQDSLGRVTAEVGRRALADLFKGLLALSRRMEAESSMIPKDMPPPVLERPRPGNRPPDHRFILHLPWKQCVEWQGHKGGRVSTLPAVVGGRWLKLTAQICREASGADSLGLFMNVHDKFNVWSEGDTSMELTYEFGVQTKESHPHYMQLSSHKMQVGHEQIEFRSGLGCSNLFGRPLSELLKCNEYFVDGALRLRADISVVLC